MEPLSALLLASGVAGLAGAAGTAAIALALRRRWSSSWCERTAPGLLAAARTLASDGEAQDFMPTALAGLGQAMGCARLELHAIHTIGSSGAPLSSLRHAWATPGLPDRRTDPALQERPWHPGRSRWLGELSAGRCVAATATALPEAAAEFAGAGSILLVPVLVGGRLWGCLACHDHAARLRDGRDRALFQLVAEYIASALARCDSAAQFRAARAEAASGDRAKREFLANISHEVRTPLNGVLGMTGLLLDTELDAHQREYAQVARTSAENLLALLNDLIDLAKAGGEQRAESLRFDPLRLAEDVVAMLAERAHAKGVEIAVHPAEELPRRVFGDSTRLRQVLVNLVGNAIKFTARGHVVVHVTWNDSGTDWLSYAVQDTGIGIAASAQARLFAAFTQGDGSTTRAFGGTGLGLAICKRMTEIMGGTVTCHSALGEGSLFTVRVPSSEGSSSLNASRSSRASAKTGTRVLVVEAEPATRSAIAALCRRIGLVPEEAAGCAEAEARLATLGAEIPRLVLVSANLPGASDLPGRLAGGPACVLLSPTARRPLQVEVARLGFAACLIKPPRTARLAEVARRALGHDHDEGSNEETATHRRNSMRVLVVEDDAVNQQLAKAVLERDGLRCDVAGDGHEALEALARARYDAVLMDLLMPVMDGFACAAEIRRLERERGLRPIPILAVSALNEIDIAERLRAAGFDGQLRKPFEPRHLRRLLRKLLVGGKDESETRSAAQ